MQLWAVALLLLAAAGVMSAQSGAMTFEGFPDSTILTTQYAGMTFTNGIILSTGISLNEFEFPPHSGTNVASDNGGPMAISFSPLVQSFSGFFTYRVPVTLRAFDSSNNQVAVAVSRFASNEALSGNPGSRPNELLQVSFAGGISKVTITADPAGGSFALDDAAVAVSAQPPSAVSASPADGAGFSQTVAFVFSDPRGWQDLGVVNVLINNFIDGRSACYLAYVVPTSTLYLVNDAGKAEGPYAGSVTLGSASAIQNSQCAVTLTSANGSGNSLTFTINAAFGSAFAGSKIFYLAARDAAQNNSGWQPLGVWQVPGGTPTSTTAVVGMNPARGSGSGPTAYTFTFSDSKGTPDLGVQNILVNSALDGHHACYLAYARSGNVLYLVNDSGDGLLPGQSLGAGGSLGNSQCTATWGVSPVNVAGNNLLLNLNLAFSPAFGGNRIFYLASRDSTDANNSGWQAMGTWLVQ